MTTARDWTGKIGDVWAEQWCRTDRSFAALAPHLDAAILAAATPETRTIIDIGCGAGATSIATAQALPDARVTGVDLSQSLIEIAGHRAEARRNVCFVCADITAAMAVHVPVDLYVSRHGVMFFNDPTAAFAALANAASSDAALVFSCFAERAANVWAVETVTAAGGDGGAAPESTTPGPFAFSDSTYVTTILETAGWHAMEPQRVAFDYRAGEGPDPVADAVDYFRRIGPAASLLREAAGEERDRRIARLTQVCERHRIGDAVNFSATAWIWTARKAAIV